MLDQFWILCGKPDNWKVALKDELWGLIPKFQGKWKHLQLADYLFFYATNPVRGVIGFGKVQAKFKQNKPLWPDEIIQNEVLYPFRFEFLPEYVLPENQWGTKLIKVNLPIGFYSGMNLLDDQDIIDGLIKSIKQNWGRDLENKVIIDPDSKKYAENDNNTELAELSHDKIKDMIFEIGKLHRYITDKEYIINSDRLDVVWRKVEKSVPTYAFEVQIGGDLYHALSKLKHAYDIWNSNIYIVTSDIHRIKIDELLAGTFHEIKNNLNIISLQDLRELYSLQIKDAKLRKEVGLP